jgi:dGTPase
VKDLISQTELNLKSKDLKSYQDVINQKNFLVSFSPLTQSKINLIKNYLYENFYTSDFVYQSRTRAEQILLFIIKFLEKDQTPLPNSWRSKIQDEDSKKQIIVDYICGMTDQYAINFYNNYA